MFNRFGYPAVALTILLFSGSIFGQTTVGPESWVMSPEDAIAYQRNVVQPLLDRAIGDPTLPAGIKRRVEQLFFREIAGQRILYQAKPFYHPLSRTLLAHVDYDTILQKPVLMVFIPALRDVERQFREQRRTNADLRLHFAITFAHEQVHLELDEKYPMRDRVNVSRPLVEQAEEAEAWAITVLEMIRPALTQGRWLRDNFRTNSEEFRKAGDNYAHPGWLQNFRSPLAR